MNLIKALCSGLWIIRSTGFYVLIVVVWLIISGFFFFRMIEEEPDTDYETQTEDVF